MQFINTDGKIVASSYGQWAGKPPQTADVSGALTTQKTSVFRGRNPSTGERIMAVSCPMIYTNGEVIGVLRYVTTLRIVDRQVFLIAVVTIAVGLLLIAFMLFMSSFSYAPFLSLSRRSPPLPNALPLAPTACASRSSMTTRSASWRTPSTTCR